MFFLGIADIIAASLLTRGFYDFPLPKIIIIVFAGYLILKAIIFIADIASFVDLGAGIVLLLSLVTVLPPVLLFILAFFLGIKGIATLFGSFRF